MGYKSSAGLMEGWLGKSKVKGEVYAKDKGGPGTCLRSKGVRGQEENWQVYGEEDCKSSVWE